MNSLCRCLVDFTVVKKVLCCGYMMLYDCSLNAYMITHCAHITVLVWFAPCACLQIPLAGAVLFNQKLGLECHIGVGENVTAYNNSATFGGFFYGKFVAPNAEVRIRLVVLCCYLSFMCAFFCCPYRRMLLS